jgi:hypothetical protein
LRSPGSVVRAARWPQSCAQPGRSAEPAKNSSVLGSLKSWTGVSSTAALCGDFESRPKLALARYEAEVGKRLTRSLFAATSQWSQPGCDRVVRELATHVTVDRGVVMELAAQWRSARGDHSTTGGEGTHKRADQIDPDGGVGACDDVRCESPDGAEPSATDIGQRHDEHGQQHTCGDRCPRSKPPTDQQRVGRASQRSLAVGCDGKPVDPYPQTLGPRRVGPRDRPGNY